MSIQVGEALCGDGAEIAHIDLMIGPKSGPVGVAFANALARQSAGHSNLLAVLTPNLAVKPSTVMISKVTIKGADQAVQMFEGTIPEEQAEDLVIVCGVFIHWMAKDSAKIQQYNYEATKLSIERAMANEPSAAEMVAGKDTAEHPYENFEIDDGGDDGGDS